MADKLTKALLLAIVLGLWANALSPWIRPRSASAADAVSILEDIKSMVNSIESDLGRIQRGTCTNDKIC